MAHENPSIHDTKKPTFVLKLLRKDGGRYGAKLGVTFETGRGNQRIVWDVVPSATELHTGTLVLMPYTEQTSFEEAAT